jgi:outer membrane protein OmpA-like peptidoglycan-associated protein
LAGGLALALVGTGCATKKYVAKSLDARVQPVETRVSGTEGKNTDQDKQLADHGKELQELDQDLSRTNERVKDADSKAAAAGEAAQKANESAGNAQKAADNARGLAEKGMERANQVQTTLERAMDAMNRYQMAKTATVLFALNQSKLTDEGKAELDAIAKATEGHQRFVIELQGFTDKTGSVDSNERLSQQRADAVARYLVNEHKIPVRSITTIGSGYASPVGDDKTRAGRAQNRRVEVRLFVPEANSAQSIASGGAR